jgi:predicted nucleic acid-binding Zn ribbon protein
MSDAPLKICPKCSGELAKMVYAAGIVYKGSGYYSTDYKNAKTASKAGSNGAKGDSDGSSDSKPDSKPATESKSESKSESKPSDSSSSE